MKIPIIIAHFYTAPRYLKHALSSAAKFNDEVILIGDASNQRVWRNHHNEMLIQSGKYKDFIKHYFKMSDYEEAYETSFWKRMFLLEEWMKSNRVDKAILLDSDIVTFMNYSTDLYPRLPKNCISALIIPKKQDNFAWVGSTHFSYWTLEGIQDFTNFTIDTYSDRNNHLDHLRKKYQWHLENKARGGVTEMTLLYLWSLQNENVFNATQVFGDITVDLHINTSENYYENEYVMKHTVKYFIFKDGVPFGYNKLLKREIQFACIHCQAGAKPAMMFLTNQMLQKFYFLGKRYGDLRSILAAQKNKTRNWLKSIARC